MDKIIISGLHLKSKIIAEKTRIFYLMITVESRNIFTNKLTL